MNSVKAHKGTQELPLEWWTQEACTLEKCDCGVPRSATVEWEGSVFAARALCLGWIHAVPSGGSQRHPGAICQGGTLMHSGGAEAT